MVNPGLDTRETQPTRAGGRSQAGHWGHPGIKPIQCHKSLAAGKTHPVTENTEGRDLGGPRLGEVVAGAPYQRYLRLFQAFDIAAGPAALCTSSAVLSNSEGVRASRAAHSTGVTPRTATQNGGGHA